MQRYGHIVFIIGLLLVGGVRADQYDKRLDALFDRLQEKLDFTELRLVESMIWDIWIDSGREDINALMARGIQAMQSRELDTALETFDRITETMPGFAEGWNKRATVHYLKNNLNESVQDIQRTLALEPRHFGALSGMGLIFMRLGDDEGALQAYREVLKIHPNSPGARSNVESLKAKLHGRMI